MRVGSLVYSVQHEYEKERPKVDVLGNTDEKNVREQEVIVLSEKCNAKHRTEDELRIEGGTTGGEAAGTQAMAVNNNQLSAQFRTKYEGTRFTKLIRLTEESGRREM